MESAVAQRPEGRLVYPSIGMLGTADDSTFRPILFAYIPSGSSNIVAVTPDGEDLVFESPTFAERTLIEKMSFSTQDGEVIIRPVLPADGQDISQYGISLPTQAVKALISPENHLKERESTMSTYFKDGTEEMYALTREDGTVIGLTYLNGFGMFKRVTGTWMIVSPGDMTFDMATPHVVNPETAGELVDMFDQSVLKADDISTYVTPVK
jgi:hypothetical protein